MYINTTTYADAFRPYVYLELPIVFSDDFKAESKTLFRQVEGSDGGFSWKRFLGVSPHAASSSLPIVAIFCIQIADNLRRKHLSAI